LKISFEYGLVKRSPPPRAMVIGDLSDVRKLAAALGVSLP
jgi:hypothetical protein